MEQVVSASYTAKWSRGKVFFHGFFPFDISTPPQKSTKSTSCWNNFAVAGALPVVFRSIFVWKFEVDTLPMHRAENGWRLTKWLDDTYACSLLLAEPPYDLRQGRPPRSTCWVACCRYLQALCLKQLALIAPWNWNPCWYWEACYFWKDSINTSAVSSDRSIVAVDVSALVVQVMPLCTESLSVVTCNKFGSLVICVAVPIVAVVVVVLLVAVVSAIVIIVFQGKLATIQSSK